MQKLLDVTSGFKTLLRSLIRDLVLFKHLSTTITQRSHDDHYLVSFPKSGATWMNFLVSNIHLLMSGSQRNVTFFNMHTIVPDVHFCKDVGPSTLPFPGFRMVKSHAEYNPFYCYVIYIIRDPRDALISYYHFACSLGVFKGSLSEFIRSKNFGVSSWVRHVKGWMESSAAAVNFTVVRYEDLHKDAAAELKRIYSLMGFTIPDAVLEKAVQLSSFEAMRESEKQAGYGGRPIADKLNFMRQGKVKGANSELSPEDRQYIEAMASEQMKAFGYAFSSANH